MFVFFLRPKKNGAYQEPMIWAPSACYAVKLFRDYFKIK